ncbi:TolC family protein [Granulicella sibirica]|uniref:Outer membrane protein n=1 Tax=Granulicella sibirica TaxID=2479048 RepID=A0A4Q0SX58_9BACT|nr:TolC family protein [Granulicella sibirica]RXH55693.1 Outer membrane protein [Granulicella sibirica]
MKILLALTFFLGLNVEAQSTLGRGNDPVPPPLPPSAPLQLAPRLGITGDVDITLTDIIRAALANNRDIEVSRIANIKSVLGVKSAKGYFDPVVGGTGYKLRNVSPQSSSLGGGTNGRLTQKELFADPQINGSSPWLGSTYKLDLSSSRQESDSTFNTLNPTYVTSANLNLVQPLWGGLLFDANRERVAVAKKSRTQTQEQFRDQVITVTTQAIRAYWELEYAQRSVEVQTEAVRLAEQQDASNRRQVAQGIEAPVDVIQTQTQISTYQQNVFNAQEQLTRAENTLKALVLPNRDDPLWSTALHTKIDLGEADATPPLDEAMHQALTHRPDVSAGRIGIQLSELDARLAKEQVKPQINLTAQLSSQGLAGQTVAQTTDIFSALFGPIIDRVNTLSAAAGLPPVSSSTGGTSTIPPIFVGGYGQSLSNLRAGSFPIVKVGLQVSIPIRNRTAIAQSGIAEQNKRQSITQQQRLEMNVESDVRNTLQQLVNSRLVLTASQRARALAEQQLASEQRQLQAGTSSVYLVLQRQNELVSAKLREIRATADCGEAEADFDRATANTLTKQNIDIAAVDKGKIS